MMRTKLLAVLCMLAAAFQVPDLGRRYLPPPLRLQVPFESVWKTVLATLEADEEELALEDRARGRILTRSREFSSGPLTESHIAKIGEKPKLIDGTWIRVETQYEISVTLIDDKQTILTVDSNIRALEREFLGGEKWVQIPSKGRLESELLTAIGKNLFGQTFTLAEPRKGFWEREPGFIPEVDQQGPQIASPERKRP